MDHILLVLMVAVVGSLLLPAMQLARVVKRGLSRTIYAHYRVSSIQLEVRERHEFTEFREKRQRAGKPLVRSKNRPITTHQRGLGILNFVH